MIKLSVCSYTLKKNKIRGDVTLNEPPIIVWEDDGIATKELYKVYSYELGGRATLVYRPESPLPNGASVYVEVEE